MKQNKILFGLAFTLALLMCVQMIDASLGTFKSGDCIDIKTILNTTFLLPEDINKTIAFLSELLADNSLWGDATTTNKGGLTTLLCGSDSADGGLDNCIFYYDLTAYSDNYVILNSSFNYFVSANDDYAHQSVNLNIYRLNQSFNETTSTWNKNDSLTNWNVVGGSYNSTIYGSISGDPATFSSWQTVVTNDLVKDLIDNVNYGIILKKSGGSRGSITINSREGANSSYLNITYYTPYSPEPPADSCTPPANDNWIIDCSDNCVISTNQNIPKNITFTGPGTVILNSIFTFTGSSQYIFQNGGCQLRKWNGWGIA